VKIGVQSTFADVCEEYESFVEKFKPKKTTDECYTPEGVYAAVASWVSSEYGVSASRFVRPFWPGGDYERYEYSDSAIVVDNPPFSIISDIITFYHYRKIKFFLFVPALTIFSGDKATYSTAVCAGASVIYDNGANVVTSFATNLEPSDIIARSAPDLRAMIDQANAENQAKFKKQLPVYLYPDEVIMANDLHQLSKHGIDLAISRDESLVVSQLDHQRDYGKALFGCGLLLSEKAAAERKAAERKAAERKERYVWILSDREKQIVKKLGKKEVVK